MKQSESIEKYKEMVKKMEDMGIEPTVIEQEKPVELPYNEALMEMFERKIESILNDYKEFHAGKGRGIQLNITITKENSADTFIENFDYDPKLKIKYISEIGTVGAYSPCDPITSVRQE